MDAAIFGLIVADVIAEPMDVRNPPAPGGLVIANSITMTTGGNVCNTGVAMAKLGMRVAAAGLVGKDVLGNAIAEKLRAEGVDTAAVFTDGRAQTSATVVAVAAGRDRCFWHTPGVTQFLDGGAFRKCFPIFKQCRYVQIGYFGLLPSLTGDLPKLLPELRAAAPDTLIALDTVNPPDKWERLMPILPHIDLFCPSRSEAAALTRQDAPDKMVAEFRKHMRPGSIVGIKLDAEGCYLDDGRKAVTVPAYKIDAIDTTGAGDTWFGGLLTGLIKGMPLEPAGRFANRAAADCCMALGASAGVKTFGDTLARV